MTIDIEKLGDLLHEVLCKSDYNLFDACPYHRETEQHRVGLIDLDIMTMHRRYQELAEELLDLCPGTSVEKIFKHILHKEGKNGLSRT